MATRTKPKNQIKKAVIKLPPRRNRRTAKPLQMVAKAVPGLKGRGLLRIGNESKLELRDRLNMARSLFGRVVNVSERTIAKVEAETDTAEKLKRPYNEVYRLFEALSDVVEVESLGGWFQLPNDAFDGLKPIEVIERGEIDRLWNMAFRLQSGMSG